MLHANLIAGIHASCKFNSIWMCVVHWQHTWLRSQQLEFESRQPNSRYKVKIPGQITGTWEQKQLHLQKKTGVHASCKFNNIFVHNKCALIVFISELSPEGAYAYSSSCCKQYWLSRSPTGRLWFDSPGDIKM